MDNGSTSKSVKFREGEDTANETSRKQKSIAYPFKRAPHLFLCRMKETAAFTVTAPNALIAAGFASMAMGLFTLFRPTPVLLIVLTTYLDKHIPLFMHKKLVLIIVVSWSSALLLVLIVLGFILTFSVKIKKRSVLLLHPWGLLVLYFDVVVWLTITLCVHVELLRAGPLHENVMNEIRYPFAFFLIIYVDCVFFFVLYYIYATYFIAAELSVIERCY